MGQFSISVPQYLQMTSPIGDAKVRYKDVIVRSLRLFVIKQIMLEGEQ